MMNKLNEMALKTYIKARYRQKGASMIEYVLIASLISVIAIAAMNGVGGKVKGAFEFIASKIPTS